MLKGKCIVVGVCGGIAAYKACEAVSCLKKLGAEVYVIMTKSALEFVRPLTLQTLSQNIVVTDMFEPFQKWEVEHIALAKKAHCFLIVPATANIIGKMAHGIADDMLSTTVMATKSPVIVAPAMNTSMYENAVVQENIKKLEALGILFVEPTCGRLACGDVGKGHLASVEDIVEVVVQTVAYPQDLKGQTVLVTAGPTRESLDPVRFLTNHASGKMGIAFANAAKRRGAHVILVSVPMAQIIGVQHVFVQTAQQMYDAVLAHFEASDIVVKAAAVGDYRFETMHAQKLKKSDGTLTLNMVKNPDILKALGAQKTHQKLVGFSMETEHLEQFAQAKLTDKNVDLMVANDVTQEGAGFGVDTNVVKLFYKNGISEALPLMTKDEVAHEVLNRILTIT
ncbi:MAG: bifunctional phosphopantothenoylcysteine decarboxylase/phosphopantothenate--cysteine ligase CoaBC [Hyphomonadaceae bacterium]|nr:bifunctional phosphopantothenoylcysteine decarboxylase/phosphopantothenate--cysteine ligase CoaBC [Clostridia bacterium]